jgi:hypothetical protein
VLDGGEDCDKLVWAHVGEVGFVDGVHPQLGCVLSASLRATSAHRGDGHKPWDVAHPQRGTGHDLSPCRGRRQASKTTSADHQTQDRNDHITRERRAARVEQSSWGLIAPEQAGRRRFCPHLVRERMENDRKQRDTLRAETPGGQRGFAALPR